MPHLLALLPLLLSLAQLFLLLKLLRELPDHGLKVLGGVLSLLKFPSQLSSLRSQGIMPAEALLEQCSQISSRGGMLQSQLSALAAQACSIAMLFG